MKYSIFLVSFLLVSSLYAQNKETSRFSINPKIGKQYDVNTGIGTTYGLTLNLFSPKIVYSAGYFNTVETMLFGDTDPKETLNDISLMFGRYFGERFFRIEGQFGLSLLWGQNRGEKYYQYNYGYRYEVEKFTTVGIPLKMGFKYMPFKFMSVGIDLQANLNLVRSFFVTFISLEFGIIRNEVKSRP